MKKQFTLGLAVSLLAMGSAMAQTNFGYFAAPVYSGNVNFPSVSSESAIVTSGNDVITLASTATARYNNSVPVATGFGTFSAAAGYGTAIPGGVTPGSTWNYDFYIHVNNTADLGNFIFRILYQTAPGAAMSTLALPGGPLGETFDANGTLQDGQNLSVLGIPPFDPNATGTYTFDLQVLNQNGTVLGQSAISVNVQNVPETGSTLGLLALAFGGIAAVGLRRSSIA